MERSQLVIGIYYHPELYPPTLNAVNELSKCFEGIGIVHRPHLKGTWKYPKNVKAVASGHFISTSDQEKAPTFRKILFFLRFVFDLLKESWHRRPSVLLLYDHQALYAYRLIRPFLFFKHKLWYHNHDVAEVSTFRKFSIGWFSCKSERKSFKRAGLFTLPTFERLRFFPMEEFKGDYYIVPNYPSLEFYTTFYRAGKGLDLIKLIFQGRIGEGHGLEEIIPLLAGEINGKPLLLVLKGHCSQEYKEALIKKARLYKVEDKLLFAGITPYEEVPRLAASCHIGIGIFSRKEVMHVTLGTASNKLYEYAAVGLPVIYLREEHFSRHLSEYEWAFEVELSADSIKAQLERIIGNYDYFSAKAHESFAGGLNFENHFKPVREFLRREGHCSGTQ